MESTISSNGAGGVKSYVRTVVRLFLQRHKRRWISTLGHEPIVKDLQVRSCRDDAHPMDRHVILLVPAVVREIGAWRAAAQETIL